MKNTFYFFVLFFIAVTALNAQAPANDACSGAQTVTPNGNCYPGTTVGSADNWIGTVGCQSANHVEVWYSFTATGSQLSVSVTPGTIGGTIEFILVQATAPCTGLSIVGSLCGSSPLTGTINGLQAGNLYYYTISSTGSAGTFTTCVNNTSPPPVAGQDCATAAILCSSATFSQSTSAAGFGVQEVSTLNSCWGSGGERQSKWFKFTVGCTGILEFNINPITNSNDYDWALWDVTTAGCPTSTSAIPTSIACNWSGCKGSTGLSSCPNSEPGVVTSGAGCGGGPAAWSTPITVTAGQTYALLVDNFSTSNTGFNLIFGGACNGGTALIGPSAAFTFTSPSCGIFNFSKSCQTTNSTFFWNFGDGTTSTLQNPSHTYTVSGNYIVTLQVTDALGCTVTTSQTMNVGIPISNAGVDQVLCSTAIGSIGTASTSGYTYSWSPSTGLSSTTVSNPSFTLTNTGVSAVVTVYTVTTSSSGCTSTDAVSVTVNPSPTVTAGSTQSITCFNTSTVLTGTSSGGVITWSGPGITGGGSTTTPTVNAAGIYTISVTSAGCTSAATVAVVANTIAPTVTATTSNSLNCSVLTSSVIVSTTTSPASYTWTGTGISAGVGTASASVNSGGTFNYSVTNPGNGCQATGTVSVIQNTTAPTVTATASGSLNCLVTSTTIVASTTTSPASYTWTGSGITGGANTASATINAGGTYNYTVTNPGNGCQATGIVAVTQNNTIPVVSASASGSINCTTSTVQTIATTTTTPVSYSWTGSGILSGANTASATVNAGGNYGYTVTNTFNQCIATGTVNVLQSAGVPSVTASSGSLNCNITSTTVIASTTATPVSYTWTGPGITSGANTATATINLGGNYIYTVTNTSNSCTATGTVSVIQNTTTPSPTASTTGTITCSTTTVNLIGGPSSLTYTWTAPAGSSVASANLATTTATGGGTYTLSVTNPSTSCSGSITLVVPTQTTNPTANIINNPSITCTNTLVMINGSPSSGVSYTWTGTGISGSANNANVNVTTTGVYTLAVTSTSNGCTSAPATVTISANTVSPSITMGSNPTIPCLPPTVQITSTVSPGTATVNWTGPNVCGGANSPTASACTPGIYTLTATNPANGCSSVSTLTVDPNSGLNVNVANTGTIYCSPSTVQVVASATPATNNTYSWSGPGIVSGNGTSSVTVNQGGTYSVVVTNTPSGCSFSYSNTVQADNTPLNIAATTNSVDCITTSANITTTVTPASGSLTYSWSNGASTQGISVSPTVSTNYIVTVTNTANGCTGSQTVNVIADTNPPTGVSVGPNNFTLTCLNTSTVLTGAATGAATYSWSSSVGSFTSPSTPTLNVTSAGTYTFIAIGANGCFATDVATVSPNSSAPVFSLTNSSPTITCGPAPTVSIVVTSTAPVSYSWSPASGIPGSNTLSTVTFTAAGTYTADVTDNNGCASSSVISVASATNPPTLTAGTDTAQPITCTNTITTLSP
ncbi:MAG: beta strand repeat-containing protein, partial [Bacteroidia bacterium]